MLFGHSTSIWSSDLRGDLLAAAVDGATAGLGGPPLGDHRVDVLEAPLVGTDPRRRSEGREPQVGLDDVGHRVAHRAQADELLRLGVVLRVVQALQQRDQRHVDAAEVLEELLGRRVDELLAAGLLGDAELEELVVREERGHPQAEAPDGVLAGGRGGRRSGGRGLSVCQCRLQASPGRNQVVQPLWWCLPRG